jgi:hypothetical protein
LWPLSLLATTPACGQDAEPATVEASETDTAAIAAAAVELSTQWGMKTVAYGEFDDQRADGRSIVGFTAIGLRAETNTLVRYPEEPTRAFMGLFQSAAEASNDGWRTVLIIVDQGHASVVTGQRIGPIEGYNARLHAEVDRVFPGYP